MTRKDQFSGSGTFLFERLLEDPLLPLTTGCSLAVQFLSYGGLPAVIHIGRKVLKARIQNEELLARYPTLGTVVC